MAMSKLVRSCTAVVLVSAMLGACGGGEERQNEYLSRAQAYFEEGNFEKAKIEVKNVLQINPNNGRARYLAGQIAEEDGNFRAAFASYSAAAQVSPKNVKAKNKLAEFFIAGKDLEKAEEQINAALEVEPQNAETLALQSMVFAQQDKIDEAIIKAQEALAQDPGNVKATGVLTGIYAQDNPDMAMDVISRGIQNQSKNESLKVLKLRLLISQNKRDEAIAMFKELIAEYPDKLYYVPQLVNYYLQDETLSEDERKDFAEKTLRDLVANKPEEEQPRLWLVEFILKNRSLDDGQALLEQYVQENAEFSELRDNLASIYIRKKEYDKAKALYQVIIDDNPTSTAAIDARNKLIGVYGIVGERDQVQRLLTEVFELDPENASAMLTRAKISLSENKIDDAIPDLRVVLKNDPESKDALSLLAKAHLVKGEEDLALDNYQQLLTVDNNSMEALVGSARILIGKKREEDALKLLEAAANIDAQNPEVAKLLTDLYSRDQRWDDALSASAQLIQSESYKALGYYLQGRVFLRKKEFNKALDPLKSSLELEPAGIETLTAIAAAYNALEKPAEAIEFVKAHIQKYPDQAHAMELLANLYAQQRELDKAIEVAERALKDNPKRPATYTLLGRLYAASRDFDKVEALYKEGISKGPEMVMLRLALAELYQATGRIDDAIAEYEVILEQQPNAIVVKNNLASLLLDKGDDPAVIQRAVNLTTDLAATENPAFLDTAGWAQYKLGNYAQAVSLLAAAVDNGGKGAIFHYHLGMAYLKSNLPAQAKEHLLMATENEKVNYPGRDEAVKALESL